MARLQIQFPNGIVYLVPVSEDVRGRIERGEDVEIRPVGPVWMIYVDRDCGDERSDV